MAEVDVLRAFSAASSSYEENAVVQRMSARDLMDMIDLPHPNSILDVGCGTGLLTRMLAEKYPDARILACDPSQKMIETAQITNAPANVEFICHGTDCLQNGCWDLIASNAVIQWMGSPEAILTCLKNHLAPNGMVAFSYFARNTYAELGKAISRAAGFDVTLPCGEFASADELGGIISRMFDEVRLERKLYVQNFTCLRELLEHIKLTGTRGTGSKPRLRWTKKLIETAEKEYIAGFGSIRASYEVVLCAAR